MDPATAALAVSIYANGVPFDFGFNNPTEIETNAIFGDITWQATDNLEVMAGFRYDKEKQTINNTQTGSIGAPLPDPAQFGPLAPVIAGINGFLLSEANNANQPGMIRNTDNNAFLPKLGLTYDLSEQARMSFVVQRGYRSGGAGVNSARGTVHTFEQEFTWNYEASLRSEWLDNKLIVNGNLFYIDWEDQQVAVQLSENVFDIETQNAGSSEVYGAEIEIQYQATDNLSTFASLGYSKTEFKEFIASLVSGDQDFSGQEFPNAPARTLAMGGVYENDKGFYASLDLTYASDRFSQVGEEQIPGEPEFIGKDISSRTIVNTKIGYRTPDYGVYLVANNLFDKQYNVSRAFLVNDGTTDANRAEIGRWAEFRIVGVTVEASF